jgi:hypothetical protein
LPGNEEDFGAAYEAAVGFWERVMRDTEISEDFHAIAEKHLSKLDGMPMPRPKTTMKP